MQAHHPRTLARSGQALSLLGLGGAALGNLYAAISEEQAQATLSAAWDAGLRYIDTAPFYGHGLSEHRVGRALRGRARSSFCISTKVGRLLDPLPPGGAASPDPFWIDALPFRPRFDYSASGVRRSLEDSLQRLGLSHVDIALVHDIGAVTHGSQAAHHWQQLTTGGGMRELERLRSEGLVGAIGLGVNESQVVRDTLAHIDLDCCLLAGRYTLLEQTALHPFLDECLQRRVGVILGGVFNSGILAQSAPPPGQSQARFNYEIAPAAVLARVAQLQAVCEQHGTPLAAAALQFVLAHPAVVACVIGARSPQELQASVQWLEHGTPPALWQALKAHALLPADAPVPVAP